MREPRDGTATGRAFIIFQSLNELRIFARAEIFLQPVRAALSKRGSTVTMMRFTWWSGPSPRPNLPECEKNPNFCETQRRFFYFSGEGSGKL
jgi:hypothetical protein